MLQQLQLDEQVNMPAQYLVSQCQSMISTSPPSDKDNCSFKHHYNWTDSEGTKTEKKRLQQPVLLFQPLNVLVLVLEAIHPLEQQLSFPAE